LARGKGVCWEAVRRGATVVVPDVRRFSGHIACDPRSLSEIVVPLHDRTGTVVAVLDVDSDKPNQFDEADRQGLEAVAGLLRL
ncbi:MAG: GAF domain-containing protein, partial [Candidatus Aminicenantes bacterium]|nr:GAF domain-containing protein [Candidatus Aminicenantes bacterium]